MHLILLCLRLERSCVWFAFPQIPVVVTAVTSDNYENSIELVQSVRKYLHDKQVHVYDLGLGSRELVRVSLRKDWVR